MSNDNLTISYIASTGVYSMNQTSGNDPFATILPTASFTSGKTYKIHVIPSVDGFEIFYAPGGAYASGMSFVFTSSNHLFTINRTNTAAYNFRFDPPSKYAMTAKQFWVAENTSVSSYTQGIKYCQYYQIPIPTRAGYTFDGWDVVGGAHINSDGIVYLESDATITAKWKINKYTVRFESNGGTGTMADLTCEYGTEYTLTENAFTKTGYSFTHWDLCFCHNQVYQLLLQLLTMPMYYQVHLIHR